MRHRDFALVQVGNGVSQLGTWGQYVALGWGDPRAELVAVRGRRSAWSPSSCRSCCSRPFGGALADRRSRRAVVVTGNLLAVPPSIALGVLVATGEQTIPLMLGLAALGGIATALTQPAMSAVVGEIVPAVELPEAVASVGVMTNLTRILGPVVRGGRDQWLGPAVGVLPQRGQLLRGGAWRGRSCGRAPGARSPTRRSGPSSLVGLRFARSDAQIRFLLFITFVVTFVVYHAALLPVIVTDLLHEGASGFALLQVATGRGRDRRRGDRG